MSKELNRDDLWNNESVQTLINNTHPDDLYEYQKNTNDVMLNASYSGPTKNVVDSACQVRLMLRDGLPVDLLTPDEEQVFIYVYGEKALEKF
jgi:hypothetical protein